MVLSGLTLCIEDGDFLDNNVISFISDSFEPILDSLRTNSNIIMFGDEEFKREFKGYGIVMFSSFDNTAKIMSNSS